MLNRGKKSLTIVTHRKCMSQLSFYQSYFIYLLQRLMLGISHLLVIELKSFCRFARRNVSVEGKYSAIKYQTHRPSVLIADGIVSRNDTKIPH